MVNKSDGCVLWHLRQKKFEFKVKRTRGKCRKKGKVFTLYILAGKDQWVNLRFVVGQKGTLNTLSQELHRSFSCIPGHSGYCETTPEMLLVMGSHQGKERLTRRGCAGLWWPHWWGVFWIKELLLVRSLMRSDVPPYRAGRIFLTWMQMEREVGSAREKSF